MLVNPVVRKRSYLDLDPDYQDGLDNVEKRRCMDEESAPGSGRTAAWLLRLDAALERKQCEVLRVQERALACRRALQMVRVGAARHFYAATLQPGSAAGWPLPSEAPHGQTSLHPAVSKLLGTSMTNVPSFLSRKSRRKTLTETSQDSAIASEMSMQDESAGEDIKTALDDGTFVMIKDEVSDSMKDGVLDSTKDEASDSANDELSDFVKDELSDLIEDETSDSAKDEASDSTKDELSDFPKDSVKDEALPKIPRYVPPIMPDPPTVCASSVRMERNRIKKRIIVGNISKWLPEEFRLDAASHKWMLYVRGPRDAPDVSDIISKVRYFLHPSYRPNDIVDVVHPFYLNRRGWGEFPVRVQLHFTLSGNRPIDIIHNLKLDRTHSGLQTLGSETVVDVWLKTPSSGGSDQLLEDESKEEVKGVSHAKPGSIVFSDGEHLTLDHKVSDEAAQCTPAKQEINEELGEREQVRKKLNSSGVKEVVFHSIPDHDYLGHGSFKTGCKSCSSDLGGETSKGFLASKNNFVDAIPEEIICNGVSEKKRRAFVQCVDDKGNILFVSLEKPNSSTKDVINKGIAGESVCWSTVEDSRFSFKKLTNGPSSSRSLLKKNVVSAVSKAPPAAPLSLPASDPAASSRSRAPACKAEDDSLEDDLHTEGGALLPRLEARTAALWALRRLPLAHARAAPASAFARRHPFCAQSLAAFVAWPAGRRLHAQWLRAKTALGVLRAAAPEAFARWSVRHLQAWARSHGLEPALPSRQRPPPPPDPLRSTLTDPADARDWLERAAEASRASQELEDVDVERDPETPRVGDFKVNAHQDENSILLPVESEFLGAEFLRNIIHRFGFHLSVEPLGPGYLYPSAQCLMLTACRLLCEDILRRSLHEASNHCEEIVSEIRVSDVRDALLTRREFDILTNVGLGVLSYSDL